MSLKDKLEIGLKPDAPYRPDNLPEHQQDDPDCVEASEPGDGPRQREARERCDDKHETPGRASASPRERSEVPASERVGGTAGAKPPGNTEDERAEAQFTAEGGPVK
jgi:hypothetical protein